MQRGQVLIIIVECLSLLYLLSWIIVIAFIIDFNELCWWLNEQNVLVYIIGRFFLSSNFSWWDFL